MTGWAASAARAVLVALLTIGVLLGAAAPAAAHFAGGREPSNFVGEVTSISPDLPGVTVRLVDNADRLEISNTTDVPLIVYGYQHLEPGDRDQYLKITADGVWVNTESQAHYLNETLYGDGSRVPEHLRADTGDGEPVWVQISDVGSYRWHDHRVHWMSETLPPQVQAAPGDEHVIIPQWKIHAKLGDAPESTITGELRWVPGSAAPWWAVVIAAALIGVGAAFVPGRARVLSVLAGVLGAASIGHLAVTPMPEDDYQGVFSFVLVAAAVPALAAAGLALLAIRAFAGGRSAARFLLGAAGVIAALQASSDLSVLTSSQLQQHGPDWLARLVVAVELGLGIGLLLAAFVLARSERDDDLDDSDDLDIASEEEFEQVLSAAPVIGKRKTPPPGAPANES